MADPKVNLPTKSLLQSLASCRVVLWALVTHGPRLEENIELSSDPSLVEAVPTLFRPLMCLLKGVLTEARDRLITCDRSLRDQKARTTDFRRERDDAFKELGKSLVGLRDAFLGAYGTETIEKIGFALQTPEVPGALYEQTEHLTVRLSDPDLVLPAPEYSNLSFSPAGLAEEMRPLVSRLGQTLDEVAREERVIDALKVAKDEARGAYNRKFLWVARTAESLFQLADLPEIAKRLRPSIRRPGLTTEVAAEVPENPPDAPTVPADDALEAPVEDASADSIAGS